MPDGVPCLDMLFILEHSLIPSRRDNLNYNEQPCPLQRRQWKCRERREPKRSNALDTEERHLRSSAIVSAYLLTSGSDKHGESTSPDNCNCVIQVASCMLPIGILQYLECRSNPD
jgi:hypothetical protein